MFHTFHEIPLPLLVFGCLTGLATYLGTVRAFHDLRLPPARWPTWSGLTGAVIGGLFVWAVLNWQISSTPEVIPADNWGFWRIVYHLSLITLLLIVTATDLRSYFILDWCCWLGIGIAVTGAVVSGHFQLAHVWVDWNAEIPQLQGPWIPDWLKLHPHLHGLAWSLAGLGTGACGMWLVRWLSSRVLGLTAMGAGDVLLMAMIGAYLGWQPTVIVLLLAPILALILGALVHLRSPSALLPYGPFLALAAIVVLFSWRFLWMTELSFAAHGGRERQTTFAVRRLFGDPVAMAIMAGLSFSLLLGLLGLLRLYKTLPVGVRRLEAAGRQPKTSEGKQETGDQR